MIFLLPLSSGYFPKNKKIPVRRTLSVLDATAFASKQLKKNPLLALLFSKKAKPKKFFKKKILPKVKKQSAFEQNYLMYWSNKKILS